MKVFTEICSMEHHLFGSFDGKTSSVTSRISCHSNRFDEINGIISFYHALGAVLNKFNSSCFLI